jgi:hypothetical protein
MTLVDELIIGILRGPDGFKNSLKKILDEDLKMSVLNHIQDHAGEA